MASPASFANFKRKEDAALDCHRLQDCKIRECNKGRRKNLENSSQTLGQQTQKQDANARATTRSK